MLWVGGLLCIYLPRRAHSIVMGVENRTEMSVRTAKDLTASMGCDGCLQASQHKQVSRITREAQMNRLVCVHIDIKFKI